MASDQERLAGRRLYGPFVSTEQAARDAVTELGLKRWYAGFADLAARYAPSTEFHRAAAVREEMSNVDDLSAALRTADQMLSRHIRGKLHEGEGSDGAFAELMACLDTCAALPGSEQVAPGIAQRRLAAITIYHRSDDDAERALQEMLRIEPELMRRAMSTLSACQARPTLLAKYLPALITELEAAVADDFNLWRALTAAYEARAELEAPGSTTTASGPPDRRPRTPSGY